MLKNVFRVLFLLYLRQAGDDHLRPEAFKPVKNGIFGPSFSWILSCSVELHSLKSGKFPKLKKRELA
jgi:hypothetical protein